MTRRVHVLEGYTTDGKRIYACGRTEFPQGDRCIGRATLIDRVRDKVAGLDYPAAVRAVTCERCRKAYAI